MGQAGRPRRDATPDRKSIVNVGAALAFIGIPLQSAECACKFGPDLGNQCAAIGAWGTQLTSEPVQHDRPSNLRHPADHDHDHGAYGSFDDKAGGFWDPSMLTSLPSTAETFVRARGRTIRQKDRRFS